MAGAATRQAFGEAIVAIGGDPRVVVLTGDLKNSTNTEDFQAKYPERFVEMGIAEGNMVGVAAGLALAGKVPWACSFAAFVANRLEQVRMSVAYTRANVRLVGTHAGIGIGDDGASQMALEDVAAMRALPGMAIVQPCDGVETHRAVEYLLDHDGPAFLRLTRQKLDDVHDASYEFRFGKAETLRDGADITLAGTGALVQECLGAADLLAKDGVSARVLNVHTIAPLDAGAIVAAARETGRIVTAEDHNVHGGLGSAVAEAIAEAGVGATLVRVGLRSFGESGEQKELYEAYGLSAAKIAERARTVL
jgi:transketolase